jgi:hypothetical protein
MDPSTLFAMIFGSEKFVPLVGELKLATQMQQANDNSSDNVNSNKLMKFRQRKREIQCALNLVQKLQSYIDLCASDEVCLHMMMMMTIIIIMMVMMIVMMMIIVLG